MLRFSSIVTTSTKLNFIVLKIKDRSLNKFINYVYYYNSNLYFIIKLNSCSVSYSTESLSLYYSLGITGKLSVNQNLTKIFDVTRRLNELLYSLNSYYFKKLRIDGKAYRINKFKNNNLKLMFGRSHKTLLILPSVFLRKKKKLKKKFMFYGSNKYFVDEASNIARSVRFNDMFTNRGIRFSKQINFRKLGKKGATTLF